MTTTADKSTVGADPWETGELGRDEKYVRRASPETESAVADALGLQMISIRLPKKLIEGLKFLATVHGVGYQPLMRDALHRFVDCELKNIARDVQLRRQREEQERIDRETKENEEAEQKVKAAQTKGRKVA